MRSGDAVHGGVAHLGERLPCTQEVVGSIPITSTIFNSSYGLGGDYDWEYKIFPTLDFLEVSILLHRI